MLENFTQWPYPFRNPIDWDQYFLKNARLASEMSKDPSTKVGCVLVKEKKIISTGYNGFPPGIADYTGRLQDREVKYSLTVHAEMNAILQAGLEARGSTLYLYGFTNCPCQNCTKHLITAGVKHVVSADVGPCSERWKEELEAAEEILKEVGIRPRIIKLDEP